MNIYFAKTAKKEYDEWQKSSPRAVDKIDELITDIIENGLLAGKGKPEQLKYFKNPPRFSGLINRLFMIITLTVMLMKAVNQPEKPPT